jgi:hypothetical protein
MVKLRGKIKPKSGFMKNHKKTPGFNLRGFKTL